MADLRLKTLTVEPSNNLTIQKGNVLFTYTTPSTSSITGAIVCDGGIGIKNTSDSTSITAGGALTIEGGISIGKQSYLGGNVFLDSNSSTLSITGNTTERLFIDSISNKTVRIAPDGIDNKFILTDTQLQILTTENTTSSSTGGVVFSGGIGILNNTESTSLGNGGSITSEGGMSIQKKTFIGGDTFVQGTSTGTGDIAQIIIGPAASATDFNNTSYIRSTSSSGTDSSSNLEFYTHQTAASSIGTLRQTIDENGDITVWSTTPASNATNGALSVRGGISTSDNSFFDSTLTISNNYTGNTSQSLVITNTTADAAGTEADSRLVIESKSDGESILQLKNTLDTTENSYDISASANSLRIYQNESTLLFDFAQTGITVFGTEASTSSTTGALQVAGGIGVEKDSWFESLVHFDSTVQLQGSSQIYEIIGGGDTPNGIAFQGKSSATSSSFNFFTADGDNTDNLALKLFNLGLPNSVANSESLELVWDSGSQVYRISSNALGTGSNRPLCFESGTTNQVFIGTSGNVAIDSVETDFKLHVAGTVNATGVVTLVDTSDATGLTNGSLQVQGGISVDKTVFAGKGITIGNGLTTNFSPGDTLLKFDIEQPWQFETDGTGASNNLILKSTIDNTQFIIRDSADLPRFTFQTSTSGTSILTIDGTQVIDYTGTEALLVRKDSDGGDVFTVDTTSSIVTANAEIVGTQNLSLQYQHSKLRIGINDSSGTNGIEFYTSSSSNTTKTGTIQCYSGTTIDTGIIQIISGNLEMHSSTNIVDTTSTEAFLVRKNSDGGDVFTVDTTNNNVIVNSTVESTSTTTGALQVRGGFGVDGNIHIGGNTDALNFTTGSLILAGGLTIQSTTNSSSVTNGGALLIGGGMSLGKDLYTAGNIDTTGVVFFKGTTENSTQYFDNTNTLRWAFGKTGSHNFFINRYNTSGIFIDQIWNTDPTSGETQLGNTTASNLTNAALKTVGGITVLGTENATSLSDGGGLTIAGGASINKKTFIGGDTVISSTTQSNDTSTGSLIVDGGLAVKKNLNVGGDTIITGNLTVQGTTSSISTTQTLLEDNIFVYNSGPSGTSDAGFLIERFQEDNDAGTGDVVSDTPTISETFPSQSGAIITTAILHAGASGSDDFYNNWYIRITSGFSSNQVRKITDYNGTTKTITVADWTSQNPAASDTFELFNKPFVGMIYNEVNDRFHFTGTDSDPGIGTVNYTDEIDLYAKNITLTGTKPSDSLSSAGLYSFGGASFNTTQDAVSTTSGGCITAAGGVSVGKNLIVGTGLTVNGASITPNSEDIYAETSFSGANNQASAANITGFAFTNAGTAAFDAWVHVKVLATSNLYEHFHLRAVQRDSDWNIVITSVGDDSQVEFSITAAGQIQYTSGNYTGFTSLTIKFRALTITF